MFEVKDNYRPPNHEDAQKTFSIAIKYLRMSDLARLVIDQLAESKSRIVIEVDLQGTNLWDPSAFKIGNQAGIVRWNPRRRTLLEYQQYGSAALALMHELGHAYQYLSEKTRAKLIVLSKEVLRTDRWLLKNLELTNTQAIELTVAHEINKELVFMRGPGYQWLEPIRHQYMKDQRRAQEKRLITEDERKQYVAELRKERRSPPPTFHKKGFQPEDVYYLTLIKVEDDYPSKFLKRGLGR